MSDDRDLPRRLRSTAWSVARGRPAVWLYRRFRSLLGPGDAARQSLAALAVNSVASLIAGAVLGAITGTLRELPGLLVMIPGAVGMRGNIFSTLGGRLSTAIHTGQLDLEWKRDSVLVQNITSSMILTGSMSVALAVIAKVVAVAVGVEDTIPVLTMAMISVLGGVIASLVVLAGSVGLAYGAVRYGWDLDNVVAPVVSTLGDGATVPSLYLATFLVGIPFVTPALGAVLSVAALASFGYGLYARGRIVRQVVRESWPILTAAALLSTLAGVALEQRLDLLTVFAALLIIQPAFVSSAGALGGILSSRLSSKLHLGLVEAGRFPDRESRLDAVSVLLIGFPVYVLNGVGAHFLAGLVGQQSPGLPAMLAVSLIAGLATVLFVIVVAYYGTVAAVTMRVDPDTYGIPVVTSSVDFAGSVSLLVSVVALGIAG